MAKTTVFDSDPTHMTRAADLKKQLQKLVNTITGDDDYRADTIDQANQTLLALKALKFRRSNKKTNSPLSFNLHHHQHSVSAASCPEDFKCPLSKELMRDPVILCTGQTYDRPFIAKWLGEGNRTCPMTQQVLSHTNLTPNHLIWEMISHWCKSQGVELLDPVHYINEAGITEADRHRFLSLLDKLSCTLAEQKEAAKELRQLTKRNPSFRALFGEFDGAIPQLLSPLSSTTTSSKVHFDLQEDVITTLLNLSIHDDNKKLVGETPTAIPVLMEALRAAATIETRTNAAAALFTLSALDSNKGLIGKSGALKPLIDLLEEGHPLAMKDVASAIYNICILHENRAKAVKAGAVSVILDKIREGHVLVNELLAILAMLCTYQGALIVIGEEEEEQGIGCLLRIIRESTCERSKENCVAILHAICFYDRTKWKQVRDEENVYGTISKLAKDGTSRAKRKASGILGRFNRAVNFTNTA
ncbi:U-box domain-containing protein 9 [Linum grandiflorum]